MKRDSLFLAGACAIVACGAILAFVVVGTPSHARAIALDEQRGRDLDTIEMLVRARYATGGRELPPDLPADLPRWSDRKDLLFDPGTGRPYVYRRVDASRFRLCVTFELPSSELDRDDGPRTLHGAGTTCRTDALEAPTASRPFSPRRERRSP